MKRIMLLAGVVLVFGVTNFSLVFSDDVKKESSELKEEEFNYLSTLSEKSLLPKKYESIKKAIKNLPKFCEITFTKESDFTSDILPKVKDYFSGYINIDDIGELLILENEIIKNRKEEYLDIYSASVVYIIQDWFDENVPLSPKRLFCELSVVSNENLADEARDMFIGDVIFTIRNLHGKNAPISTALENKAIHILSGLFSDKQNASLIRGRSVEALAEFGEKEETIDMLIRIIENKDEDQNVVNKAFEGAVRFKTNTRMQNKILYIMDNPEKYLSNTVDWAIATLARMQNEKAINMLMEKLNTATNEEELADASSTAQQIIKKPYVFESILKNYERLGIDHRRMFVYDSKLLVEYIIEYIKIAKDEYVKQVIKILHSKIYSLAAYISGDIPYYDKAVEVLKNRLNHPESEVRREIIFTLVDIASQSLRDKMLQDDNVYENIRKVLTVHSEKETDLQLKEFIQKKLESLKSRKEEKKTVEKLPLESE